MSDQTRTRQRRPTATHPGQQWDGPARQTNAGRWGSQTTTWRRP
jgi:hypothetical protein